MIDPKNITNTNLSLFELEEHLLFWILAAGKNGTTSAKLLHNLLEKLNAYQEGPFNVIKPLSMEKLIEELKACGIGCFTHKARTIFELVNTNMNLMSCSCEDLEKIYGIGMKTSRCFIIHSRKNSNYAGLDTHMLKNLKANGVERVPISTPTSKNLYKRLELEVLKLASKSNMSPTEYDLMIWNKYSKKGTNLNV